MATILSSSTPRCIYIHIPFCLKKCRYCDFYSLPAASSDSLQRYSQALLTEIDRQAAAFPDSEIKSIYLGGGTPSLLNARQIESILTRIWARFTVDGEVEVSLEANPATLDQAKLKEMIGAGINRVSLGVQSFDDAELRMLGRVHGSREVFETLETLNRLPVKNYNIDLIYGLPGQSIDSWLKNLTQAVCHQPQHISMYLLQLDPSTPMGRDVAASRLVLLDEDDEANMYYAGIDYLNSQGYRQYEISNLCKPGAECRHNLFYWQADSYLGLGAGAVSFTGNRRYQNRPDVDAYLRNQGTDQPDELEQMDELGLISDAVILGLRLTEGIDVADFYRRFGVELTSQYSGAINTCKDRGLLELKDGRLFLTRAGYFLSNEVLCRFMA